MLSILLALVGSVVIATVRRDWMFAPLILCMLYVPRVNVAELGVLSFTPLQCIVLAGLLRTQVRSERPPGAWTTCDVAACLWGAWMIASVAFHDNATALFANRLRWAFDGCGLYYLFRTSFRSPRAQVQLALLLAVAAWPIAAAMAVEHTRGYNLLSLIGGVPAAPTSRGGSWRAQGAFAIHILAGTVGALLLPLAASIWRRNRTMALSGGLAGVSMVVASASSGPVLTLAAGVVAILSWPARNWRRAVILCFLPAYIVLDLAMEAPAYYLMARIDLTGSSTGWHRARLIEASLKHLSEWAWFGTDYTRHWMPTGVTWSDDHTDITNHYIKMGVLGGIALMSLFIAMVVAALRSVSTVLSAPEASDRHFEAWCLGAALVAVSITGLSVSFADQSIVLVYCLIALAESLRTTITYRSGLESPRGRQSRMPVVVRLGARRPDVARRTAPSYNVRPR